PFEFFAGRDHSSVAQVRRTQEHSPVRQHWEPRAGRASPGTGRKNPGSGHLSPRSGAGSLANWTQGCAPWASIFRPPGSVRSMLFAACRFAGRPILPAAGSRSFHYFVPAAPSLTLEKTAVSTVVATCEQTPKPTYTGSFRPTYSTGPTGFSSSLALPANMVKRLPCLTRRRRAGPSTCVKT